VIKILGSARDYTISIHSCSTIQGWLKISEVITKLYLTNPSSHVTFKSDHERFPIEVLLFVYTSLCSTIKIASWHILRSQAGTYDLGLVEDAPRLLEKLKERLSPCRCPASSLCTTATHNCWCHPLGLLIYLNAFNEHFC
jgi:hypothetical protein